MKILVDEDGETFVRRPGPCPLPDDVVIKNHAYAKKLLAGLVDPVTGEELPAASTPTPNGPLNTDPVITDHSPSSALAQNSGLRTQNFLSPEVIANTNLYDQKIDAGEIRVIYAPGKHYEIEYCNRADQPALERLHKSAPLRFFEDPTRTQWLPALRTFGKNPYIPPTAVPPNTDSPITDLPITEHSPSSPSALKSEISNQKSEIEALSPAELAAAVDRYTVNRIREYIRHNQNHTPWPYRHPAPEFITEERHCPCGHACPCPTHETIPDVGPFPPIFWKKSPFDAAYAECLRDRNLPFRRPDEYLP